MLLCIRLISVALPGRMLLDGCLLWPASSGHLGYHSETTRGSRRSFGPSVLGRHLAILHNREAHTYKIAMNE